MEQLVNDLTQFIHANQEWAGLILGLMTMGESLLIVGIAIPATAIMLVVGGLIGSGTVEPLPVIGWGILGAIIGDGISYYIGRWLGPQIIHRWPLNRQKRAVARARLFFYKYGMLSIFGGRFLGPLRAVIPTVAGIMKMRHWRFQVANIASAFVWVPVMLLPGYLTARSIGSLGSNGGNASIIISSVLSVVIAVWITLVVIRKRRTRPTDQ
ncbi:DedA family protein [Pusillimonas sp. DMV24BSW_D]|uniref:DedA family protein n=1 Tax=Neopusillimonas aestuarii TaxID=2716226 RepID=UPI0014097DEE|nr:DedA family protein [Pusillimonas sp. DMV24BSW_D]QIM49450.1 DedA family protein [Pusillimonas sp. DMV24BSW_D]